MGGSYWQPRWKREESATKRNQSARGKNKSKPTKRHLMDKYLALRKDQWDWVQRAQRPWRPSDPPLRNRFFQGIMVNLELRLHELEKKIEELG